MAGRVIDYHILDRLQKPVVLFNSAKSWATPSEGEIRRHRTYWQKNRRTNAQRLAQVFFDVRRRWSWFISFFFLCVVMRVLCPPHPILFRNNLKIWWFHMKWSNRGCCWKLDLRFFLLNRFHLPLKKFTLKDFLKKNPYGRGSPSKITILLKS